HQHQAGVAVVIALDALVAGHVLGRQAEVVLDVHGRDLKLVGDGVGLQQLVCNGRQLIGTVFRIVRSGRTRIIGAGLAGGGGGGGRRRRAGGAAGIIGRSAAACQQGSAENQCSQRKQEITF